MPEPEMILVRRDDLEAVLNVVLNVGAEQTYPARQRGRLLAAVNGPAASVEDRRQLSPDHPYGVRVYHAEYRHVGPWLPVNGDNDA